MCGPGCVRVYIARGREYRRHIKRRHPLIKGFAQRVDHVESGSTLSGQDRRRCGRTIWGARRGKGVGGEIAARRGGVVVIIALVEPDFVADTRTEYVRCDSAGFRVQDY